LIDLLMKPRLSLSAGIFLGLLTGILCGVFLGEYCSPLRIFGEVFIRLLQMSVLPFIVVSLVAGVGRLSYTEAKLLAVKAGGFLFLFWGIAAATILLMPLAFPPIQTASFFSNTMLGTGEHVDFLDLFIPSNPFRSLAKGLVPAAVLFSISVGIALIGVREKQGLLSGLAALSAAFTRMAHFILFLTPVGVFAIAASAAGTMTLEQFGRLQVYIATYVVAALLLTFWVLPMLLTALTPFKYRDCLGLSRDALVTGFATGSLFLIIPLLIDNCRSLFERHRFEGRDPGSLADVIIPVSFNFPTIGKLLALLFIPFVALFSTSPFSAREYSQFIPIGITSMFAGANVALPFILDHFRIPSDLFQLFVAARVLTDRFKTLLSVMNLLVFTILTICAMRGLLTMRWRKLVRYTVLTLAIALSAVFTTRVAVTRTAGLEYSKYKTFVEMELLSDAPPARIGTAGSELISPPEGSSVSRLDRVVRRGSLRVGYFKDSLPFAFVNSAGHLVGFDIEMAHLLAKALGVRLDLVRVERSNLEAALRTGRCDIIMSGVAVSPQRLRKLAFSHPYMDVTVAFLVKDERREEFESVESVRRMKAPRIAVINHPYFVSKVRDYLQQLALVPLDSPREFFKRRDLDALVFTAEGGSAWTLVYPDYSVALPRDDVIKLPLAYPLAPGDWKMLNFINGWLDLKKGDKTIDKLFEYWILGHGARARKHRWSVIRDVLHWVD